MVIPSPTWSSQSAWSVVFITLVSYEDVINAGMKTKPVYSLQCSPVSKTIVDTAYYTNISSEVCGTNCQPLKGGNCYTYGDGLCGLMLSPSDVRLLYRNCYSDNNTCGQETFSAMSRKEGISLLFLCSTGDALDPCEPHSGESTVLFRNFGGLDPLCNTSCTCDVEVPYLMEGGSLQVNYLMFSGFENSGRASINATLSLPGSSEFFLNVSTYPVSQHLPVVTNTLTFSVTLHISGQEDQSARFWLRLEKRAKIVCYGSRYPLSTQAYPDTEPEEKHDGENDERLWTSAGIVAIVTGLSAVAGTVGLVICATKRCAFFRPRKKLLVCLQPLSTLGTDTAVSQMEVSVECHVDPSTTDTNVYEPELTSHTH